MMSRFLLFSVLVLTLLSCQDDSNDSEVDIVFREKVDHQLITNYTAFYKDNLLFWTRDQQGRTFLESFNTTARETTWQMQIQSELGYWQPLTVYDDYLLIGGDIEVLHVYDLVRGQWLLNYDFREQGILGSVAVPQYLNGKLYGVFYYSGRGFVATSIDVESGEVEDLFDLGGGITRFEGWFDVFVDAETGEVGFLLEEKNFSDPFVGESIVFLAKASETIVLDTMVRHNRKRIAAKDDYVLVYTANPNQISAYSNHSGELLWKVEIDCASNPRYRLHFEEGGLFVYDGGGASELSILDQEVRWCRSLFAGRIDDGATPKLVGDKLILPTYSHISILDSDTGIPIEGGLQVSYPKSIYYNQAEDIVIIPSEEEILGVRLKP